MEKFEIGSTYMFKKELFNKVEKDSHLYKIWTTAYDGEIFVAEEIYKGWLGGCLISPEWCIEVKK